MPKLMRFWAPSPALFACAIKKSKAPAEAAGTNMSIGNSMLIRFSNAPHPNFRLEHSDGRLYTCEVVLRGVSLAARIPGVGRQTCNKVCMIRASSTIRVA